MSVFDKAFVFLGDTLLFKVDEPVELIKGYFLKRANFTQVEYIKNALAEIGNKNGIFERYETAVKAVNGGRETKELPPSEWNYVIIEHDDFQAKSNLRLALMLSKLDLNPVFEYVLPSEYSQEGKVYQPEGYHNFFIETFETFSSKKVTSLDVEDIRSMFSLLEDFTKIKYEFKYIYKALSDFESLKLVSRRTPFKIIGMFSIIEALLTNDLQRSATFNHQLKSKLNLLNNRFEECVNYRKYVGGADTTTFETIIDKLYNYRHDIAHGDFSNFNKDLKVIVDEQAAFRLLYAITKKLIVQSLKEPQLVKDLKYC